MSDKGDKSLEDIESSQCNYSKGGLVFCISPPPRNNLRRKEKSEKGDGTTNGLVGPVREKVVPAGEQQNKSDRPTEGQLKGEAFCISPPVPKKISVKKGRIQDVQRPQIIEKLRNGRLNAPQISPRQPLKADHSISNGQGNEISSSTAAGQTNDKVTTKLGYKSDSHADGTETANLENKLEGRTNNTRAPTAPDQSTGAVYEPHSDYYTDETDRETTNRDDEKSTSLDAKGQCSTTTEVQDEKEKQRKVAQARFMLDWKQSFDQNRREIQKLREQVNKAKEGVSQMCEEEENWKCRLEMQKGVVNASLKKIEHKKEENPLWYSGAFGAEPTLEQLKSYLTESRKDLVYQLSRVRRVTQEAVKEKVMERRRLGESYPQWLLPNFRKAYSKYSDKHLFNDSLIQSVCPKLDIIVPIQKRPDNSRRYYRVLIEGRYFNYKKTGLTQVMGLMNEEVDRDGKLELSVPIKITSNETQFERVFRKPHNTHAIDMEIIRENGCNASIISLVDEKMSGELKLSPSLQTSAADRITGFKGDSEPLIIESASVLNPHPPPSPKLSKTETTAFRRDNQNITQKVKENTARVNQNETKSKPRSANGAAGEDAKYTSPLNTPYKQPKSLAYVISFDESKSPQQQMRLEQLGDHKSPSGEENSGFGDGENNNIVQPIEINRSKANFPKRDTSHNIKQMEQGNDKKVKDTREKGLSRCTGKEKHGDTDGSDSWQHGHSVLPPIGQSMEEQTTEEEIATCKINTTLCDKKVSVQCDLDVVPVKVPHRTPLSNVVTYFMTLVTKDTIIPLSLARQGSLIPIRNKRFSIPKHESQRKIERWGRVDGCNVTGAKKRGVSRSPSKQKCNDTMGSRSWQKHPVLPPIGKTAEHQRTEKKITKRVTNVKLGDRTVSIVCETTMIPVKILHRSPPSNTVTYVVTLVEKDFIIPFSLARQDSLIPIRPKYQTVEEKITKCEINSTLCDKKVSVQCDLDVIPVKVPHRTPLSNVVTYVMTLVRKDTIMPLSLARQGSLIPISIPKHGSQREFERQGRVDGCNIRGAQKSSLSRSSAKKIGNDTMGSRSWQRHSVLPPIGKMAKDQRTMKKITKRVTNVKLGDRTVSIVCETTMIPVKVLHRSPPSNNLTYVVILVEKDIIIPLSLARQDSHIPIRPLYIKQDIRELLQREQNQPHMQNLQNRYLYTTQERSQEFDDGFYGSPTDQAPLDLPFASYQGDQPNSPLGSYPQDEINTYSEAMQYEMQYTQDSPYRPSYEYCTTGIYREASVVSLGFTPGGNVYDVTESRSEECRKEDEETNDIKDGRFEKDQEELITDWSAFFSPRNSNANCCGYLGSATPACADDSMCGQVLVSRHTSAKNPAANSNSRRCQVLVPHPPSSEKPATVTYRRRSFVRVKGLF